MRRPGARVSDGWTRPDAAEAADEIERLRAERDRLAAEVSQAHKDALGWMKRAAAARREGIEAAIVACGAVSADTEGVWANGFTRGVIEAQASIRALLEEDGR